MASTIKRLQGKGFDRARPSGFKHVHVGCSQCAALVINGVACHENGCPNQTWECKGCNAQVSRRGAYCVDCQ